MDKLKDNRNYIIVFLLSIITFGIYGMYLTHVKARDTNIACADDGRHTAGLLKLILFSIITFGIYALVWEYKLVSRWEQFVEGHGERSKYTILIHIILSYVLSSTGVCAIIADVLKLYTFNQVCKIYNYGSGWTKGNRNPNSDKKYNPADDLWGWKNSTSSKL